MRRSPTPLDARYLLLNISRPGRGLDSGGASRGSSAHALTRTFGWAVRDLNPRPLARHALSSRPEGFDEVRARRHRPRSEAQRRSEAFESVRPESRLGCCSRCCTSRAWIRIPAGSRRVSTKLGGLKYWTLAGNPRRHQVLNGVAEPPEVLAPGGLPSPLGKTGASSPPRKSRPNFDGWWDPEDINLDTLDPLLLDFSNHVVSLTRCLGSPPSMGS